MKAINPKELFGSLNSNLNSNFKLLYGFTVTLTLVRYGFTSHIDRPDERPTPEPDQPEPDGRRAPRALKRCG